MITVMVTHLRGGVLDGGVVGEEESRDIGLCRKSLVDKRESEYFKMESFQDGVGYLC